MNTTTQNFTSLKKGVALGGMLGTLFIASCTKDSPLSTNTISTYAIYGPYGVAVDTSGALYVTDTRDYEVVRVTSPDIVKVYAGIDTSSGFSGDGGLANDAHLGGLTGIATDKAGNIYFTDNNRIRTVNFATKIITTLAGGATTGYTGDGGPATAALFSVPANVATDTAGNIYITDYYNNRVRKITSKTGVITTVAGNGTAGRTGDGGMATAAELNYPDGVAVDDSGNIYIGDRQNFVIRKVYATTGIIITIAGNGTYKYTSDGNPATAVGFEPSGSIALDSANNLYITDIYNFRVYQLNAKTNIINTAVGTGIQGNAGDNGPASIASVSIPTGVCTDKAGDIFIVDQGSNCVREINAKTHIITTVVHN